MIQSTKIIHLDLDGVLYDLNARVKSILGKTLEDFNPRIGAWLLLTPYQDLFKDLELRPDAIELVNGVKKFAVERDYKIEILTAVPFYAAMPLAAVHKRNSVQRDFSEDWKFKIGPYARDKHEHCKPGDILIDDSILNIQQWNAKGGFGILHKSAEETLNRLNNI
jgi:hypothetical protein